MTDEDFKTAKDALETLSKASELASKFTDVSKIIVMVGKITASFACVGAVFGLIEDFAPDPKHEEILRCFEKLNNKVDQVIDDIKKLGQTIKWENTKMQYADAVSRIKLGMKRCVKIGGSKGKEKERNQDRLKQIFACDNFTLALDVLFEGLAGKGTFRKSIFDEFYSETNGDRKRILELAMQLVQLVCGGIMVISTYETMMYGEEGEKEVTEQYDGELMEVCLKVKSVIDKCKEKFKDNMLTDLNAFLDQGVGLSNESLVVKVSNFMRNKYDWLENHCLVYNDLHGFDQHFITGNRVNSLNRSGKCGVVFYRTNGERPRFSDRYDEVCTLVSLLNCGDAQVGYNNIKDNMNDRAIEWSGCAVVTRFPDLRAHGNFTTKIVYSKQLQFLADKGIFRPNAEVILLLK